MKKTIGAGVLGLVIGGAASWGNMYARLQPVEQRASQAEAAREEATKAAKALEGQLKEKAREAADKTAAELKGQLTAAVSAREAAEQALAEAKKSAAPPQ